MARKDDIFKSFLNNELLERKYNIQKKDLPNTVYEGLHSDKPIVKAIALIVDGLERTPPVTENELRTSILQYLNTAI